MKTTLFFLGVGVLSTALSGVAYAGCTPSGVRAPFALRAPLPKVASTPSISMHRPEASPASAGAIVGLWDVTYASGGQFFDEGYDQFHSDGTEILNDIGNPALDNVCLGVYQQSGPASVKLHHVFWNFDNGGNIIGRGTWDSDITLTGINSYTGSWVMKNYDLNGNLVGSAITGTLQATRIVVN